MAYGVRQVPQNIMSIEFKIFDIMTLKQFIISVVLLIICFLIFYGLADFAPWNLVIPIFIIIVGGIVIFVPFNGEPFQEFFSSYIEAMISPQRRIWHKKGVVLKSAAEKALYYRYGEDVPHNSLKLPVTNPVPTTPEIQKLDQAEQAFLQNREEINNNLGKNNNFQEYVPPQQKTINTQNNFQTLGTFPDQIHTTNISDKSLFNSIKISDLNEQNTNLSFIQKEKHDDISPRNQNSTPEGFDIEAAVKNFIFGSVEDYDDKPVEGATVYLKNFDTQENIEVLRTNQAGEFRTSYEYPSGKYIIQVIVNNNEFNNVVFDHRPIDPQPIVITPFDYERHKSEKTHKNSEEEFVNSEIKGDVFEGTYDPFVFSIGNDYAEIPSQLKSMQILKETAVPELLSESDKKDFFGEENTLQGFNDSVFGAGSYRANSNNTEDISNQMNSNTLINDDTNTASTVSAQNSVSNYVRILDFNTMPNAIVPFDQYLVELPNTINGILVDQKGYGIAGALLRVFDKNGSLITSMRSDNTGRFYSFSPLPNGYYTMYISKDNQNLVEFNIILNGSLVPPKFIQFIR